VTILDVGGENVGASVLAVLGDAFKSPARRCHVIQVVNPYRPSTDTTVGCLKSRDAIEAASGLKVTGWAGNANFLGETDFLHVRQGLAFMQRLAEESALPLLFVTLEQRLLSEAAGFDPQCALLIIERQLVPPWEKAVPLSP